MASDEIRPSDRGRPTGTQLRDGLVRGLRTRQGLTQGELARLAGVTTRTIAAAEAGRPMSSRTIRELAGALGVALSELSDRFAEADP